jgi:HK97 family phage major capsid protein
MAGLRPLLERRSALKDRMNGVLAQHPEELPEAAQQEFDALRAEADVLEQRIQRQAVVDDLERRVQGQPIGAGSGDAGLDRELRSFSLVRAIASQVPGLNVDAGRERELSQEIARRAGRPFQGMAVPMSVFRQPVEQRTVTTALPVAGPGSNIIPTDYRADQYIDLLRESLIVKRLGARVLSGLTGNVAIPGTKASATASWVNEDQAIPATDMQFRQVTLTPKHVGARTEFSRNMLLQSSPDIEQLVRSDFAAVLAAEVDRAAIAGTGTAPEPRGVLNTSGIGIVAAGTNGGAISYDLVVDLIGAVEDARAGNGSMAFVTNRKVKRHVLKLKDAQSLPIGADVIFQGHKPAFADFVPGNLTKGTGTNLSALIYGNWSELMLGYWSEFDLLVNPYEGVAYSKGNVQVRGMVTMDVAVRHAESFAAIKDLVTA